MTSVLSSKVPCCLNPVELEKAAETVVSLVCAYDIRGRFENRQTFRGSQDQPQANGLSSRAITYSTGV